VSEQQQPTMDVVRVERATLRAVRFKDERSRAPTPWEGLVLDLVGSQHLTRVEKKGTPAFSPLIYEDGATRGKRGIRCATALVLDFDHLAANVADQVWQKLRARGWALVGYSSFSHLADGPDDSCFRVVVLVSRPILPEEYEPVWLAANAALGRVADANARDVSRLWFVASCPPERLEHAWVRVVDGRPLDVDRALSASALRPRGRVRKGDPSAAIAEGERNAGLLRIGGGLRRRGAGRDELLAALHAANIARCVPPLPEDEVTAIVDSLLRYDPASPLITLNATDAGNAERLQALHGARLAYVHAWGSWYYYDGVRWTRDTSGEATRGALGTLRATAAEAEKIPDEDHRGELLKHALDSESSARIAAMLTLAQSVLPISPDELDRDLDLLNVANGTLDLRTGELRPHHRDDWLTRLAPVAYEPEAACPRWEAFLLRAMGGSTSLVSFLQRAVGYSLTGQTNEQVLFLLYGVGANGKSTFLETIRALMGDLSAIADFNTFLKREGEGARNDIARLVGTRFVSAVEAEAGKPLAEALVKQLTGGDTVTARFLFKEFFDFKPQFKIWLAANHKPAIGGSDHGIWRRIRLVPFTVTIPEHERDPRLTQKLAEELPGILAWAVRGSLTWRQSGLGLPEEVKAATASYREEMDAFAGFVEASCVAEVSATVPAADLYTAYAKWCEANGERARSQKSLAAGLRERGFEAAKGGKGVRVWRGIRVRRDGEPVPPPGGGWRMGGAFPAESDRADQSPQIPYGGSTPSVTGAEIPDLTPPSATDLEHPSSTLAHEVADDEKPRFWHPPLAPHTCHPGAPSPVQPDAWEEGEL
jgi:putative DNA primase/helicase